MPAGFTHYAFGNRVLMELPPDIQSIVQSNLSLYQIGQHGPDIIFYYRPFLPNSVSRVGFQMHKRPARSFFEQARTTIQLSRDTRLTAYTLGFLCHFMLDSECHGYIKQKVQDTGIAHAAIETEFDRLLMLEAGKNPFTTNPAGHLKITPENAELVSRIFVPLTTKQIYIGLRSMKFYSQLLLCPTEKKRKFLQKVLKTTHTEEHYGGLIMRPNPHPCCLDSNIKLYQLYDAAVAKTISVLIEYYQSISSNAPLSQRFDMDYNGTALLIKNDLKDHSYNMFQ